MADIKKLAEELVNLTVKEVNELAGILKDEYGIQLSASYVLGLGTSSTVPHAIGQKPTRTAMQIISFRII